MRAKPETVSRCVAGPTWTVMVSPRLTDAMPRSPASSRIWPGPGSAPPVTWNVPMWRAAPSVRPATARLKWPVGTGPAGDDAGLGLGGFDVGLSGEGAREGGVRRGGDEGDVGLGGGVVGVGDAGGELSRGDVDGGQAHDADGDAEDGEDGAQLAPRHVLDGLLGEGAHGRYLPRRSAAVLGGDDIYRRGRGGQDYAAPRSATMRPSSRSTRAVARAARRGSCVT